MQEIATIASSGVLSAAVVFLFRNWISERIKNSIRYEYDQKLETYKDQLRNQTETDLVRLKAELEIKAAEQNFRFSHVFEKTAETIAETYRKIVELKDASTAWTMFVEGLEASKKDELGKILVGKKNEFLAYYLPNKIYIPRQTAKKIQGFVNALDSLVRRYTMLMQAENLRSEKAEVTTERYKKFEEVFERVPTLLDSLEDDFQKILGFPIENKPAG